MKLIGIIGIMLLPILGLLLGYLVTTGFVWIIFKLLYMGGVYINFSTRIAGGIVYILWLMFGRK